jgi:hypothetical protein
MKMTVFWVVGPCSVVEVYRRFRSDCKHPEDSSINTSHHENLKSRTISIFTVVLLLITLSLSRMKNGHSMGDYPLNCLSNVAVFNRSRNHLKKSSSAWLSKRPCFDVGVKDSMIPASDTTQCHLHLLGIRCKPQYSAYIQRHPFFEPTNRPNFIEKYPMQFQRESSIKASLLAAIHQHQWQYRCTIKHYNRV